MATATQVAKERELAATQARQAENLKHQWYLAWKKWCQETEQEPSDERLMFWDERFNQGRIRKSFGSREEIYRVGLIALYRRFAYAHAMLHIKSGKKGGFLISELRKAGDHRAFVDAATPQQWEYFIRRLEQEAFGTAERLAFLRAPRKQSERRLANAFEKGWKSGQQARKSKANGKAN